jgi:hypothetical protein
MEIKGVMVTMLIWSLVYHGFKPWSGQIRGVMVTMLIWSLVYRGFKLWSGQIRGVMVTMLSLNPRYTKLQMSMVTITPMI